MPQSNVTAEIIELPKKEFATIDFEITPEAVTNLVKKYNDLDLIPGDKESYDEVYRVYRKFVTVRTSTDKRRKSLGTDAREFVSRVNSTAKLLLAPLEPYEKKFRGMLDAEDNREKAIEADRVNKLDSLISDLEAAASFGLQYNRTADQIAIDLGCLETFEISAVDFEERTEEAERIKQDGITNTQRALKNRIDHEETQAEQARLRVEQEVEAEKLKTERAEFEAARVAEREKQKEIQELLDADNKIKEDEMFRLQAQLGAERRERDREAKKIADEQQAAIDADRKALENQQAEIREREEAANLKEYSDMWDEAERHNRVVINDSALAMDSAYNKTMAENEAILIKSLGALKARKKMVAADKKILISIANAYDKYISNTGFPEFKTKEAQEMALVLIGILKGTIHSFEESARELI